MIVTAATVHQVQVRAEPGEDDDGHVIMSIRFGEGTDKVPMTFALDPATALVLSGQLEAAAQKLVPPQPQHVRIEGATPVREPTKNPSP